MKSEDVIKQVKEIVDFRRALIDSGYVHEGHETPIASGDGVYDITRDGLDDDPFAMRVLCAAHHIVDGEALILDPCKERLNSRAKYSVNWGTTLGGNGPLWNAYPLQMALEEKIELDSQEVLRSMRKKVSYERGILEDLVKLDQHGAIQKQLERTSLRYQEAERRHKQIKMEYEEFKREYERKKSLEDAKH